MSDGKYPKLGGIRVMMHLRADTNQKKCRACSGRAIGKAIIETEKHVSKNETDFYICSNHRKKLSDYRRASVIKFLEEVKNGHTDA